MITHSTTERPGYFAMVDLLSPEQPGGRTYALVKQTFSVRDGACRLAPPRPLLHDYRREDLEPRIRADTDFWHTKEATDVVVLGAARGGPDVCRSEVSVKVGEVVKRVTVFGRRAVTWSPDGRPYIQPPEPFDEVPLTAEHAYGGVDWRVQPEDAGDPATVVRMQTDHPGLYPRNPFGKGYLVVPGEVPEMEMPNLEDPSDLLTAEWLVTGDPALWHRQPLPWCLDWTHPAAFPRNVMFTAGVDAWFEGPEDVAMPEVARGLLEPGYRSMMADRDMTEGPHPRFFQGASHGLVINDPGPGAPVELRGMHPELDVVSFSLPPPPSLRMAVDGDWQAVRPRLHHVICEPGEERVSLVYGADRELTRPFVPGIHKKIPVALSVDGDAPLEYDTPPTVKEQMAAAMNEAQHGKDHEA